MNNNLKELIEKWLFPLILMTFIFSLVKNEPLVIKAAVTVMVIAFYSALEQWKIESRQ